MVVRIVLSGFDLGHADLGHTDAAGKTLKRSGLPRGGPRL